MNKPTTAGDEQDAPILVELRLRLESATDPAERSVLRMRQGLYLARTNRLAEAEAMPAEVRQQWAGQETLRVYVWLWILEGVLAFYRSSRTSERLRLLQAHAAASQAGWRAEAEIAAAWLAHFAYVDSDYPAMTRWLLASGLGTAALEESSARSSLTLACALQLFGEEALAATWFSRSREVARLTGDRAGIMAASANRSMLKLNDNWLNFVFGEPLRHEPEALRQELMGILGYERLSGSESLSEQNEVALTRLAILRGDADAALSLAQGKSVAQTRSTSPSLGMAPVTELWLLARRGPSDAVLQSWQHLQQSFTAEGLDDDDAAGCWALLAQVAQALGHPDEAGQYQAKALAARQRFLAPFEQHRAELLGVELEAAARWHVS
jgi:hypothetical protein